MNLFEFLQNFFIYISQLKLKMLKISSLALELPNIFPCAPIGAMLDIASIILFLSAPAQHIPPTNSPHRDIKAHPYINGSLLLYISVASTITRAASCT
jgi:hypothetical protein